MLEDTPSSDVNRQESLTLMSEHEAKLALARAQRLANDTPAHLLCVTALLNEIFDSEEDPTETVDTGSSGKWHVA